MDATELTLEATWGGAVANSYIALDDTADFPGAETLIRARVRDIAPWEAASVQERQRALMDATTLIDAQNWIDVPYAKDQRLAFPRATSQRSSNVLTAGTFYGLIGTDSYYIAQWYDVRIATCLQAVYLLARPFDRSRDDLYRGVRSASMGSRLQQAQGYTDVHMDLCPAVWDVLKRYRGTVRIVRG